MGLLNLFGNPKKKETFEFPEKEDLDIPPAPPSTAEDAIEMPDFPAEMHAPEEMESPVNEAEEKAVKAVKEDLSERDTLELKKPIFVKYRMYKAMLDEIGQSKLILKDAEEILTRVADFKGDEDKEFSKWHRGMEDIQRKLIYTDKILFGK